MSSSELAPDRAGAGGDCPAGFALGGVTFVLVHGAFHGGWCWRAVAAMLRDAGHSVFTPTLTGLGERRHLISADLTVDVFIADVMNVIEAEDLREVVLVGHSFGGIVISGVADRMAHRLRQLIYLDAVTPIAGKSLFDMMPEGERAARLAALAARADGHIQVPPPPARAFGVTDPALAAWTDRRLTPHPAGGYTSPVTLTHPLANGVPAAYIRCTDPVFPINDPCAAHARSQAWAYREIATGHDAMISAPAELAAVLLDLSAVAGPRAERG